MEHRVSASGLTDFSNLPLMDTSTEAIRENPFRDTPVGRSRPQSCTVVIFGATGDLTHRKLLPALYNLAVDGDLPQPLNVIGFARRDKSDDEFREGLKELNRKISRQGHSEEIWEAFAQRIGYHRSTFQDIDGYKSLEKKLQEIERTTGGANRLFYLASAPGYFDDILDNLKASGLNRPAPGGWSRVVVEKPFGTDFDTAHSLNKSVNRTFDEKDTYRIDHYLGKETAQNLMVLRFANAIFEPLWNSHHIDCVQITCAEHFGMEGGRGAYYDKAGALRDMVQNHLLQLFSLVAMEPPTDLSADSVRDEKVKTLRSLVPLATPQLVTDNVVRAQYTKGSIHGENVPGYREEDRVDPKSMTESYVALRLELDTWRWAGVPFYVRMGKRLPRKATEISVHFKTPPSVLFQKNSQRDTGNELVIRIQPEEGHALTVTSKVPGASIRLEPVKMDFHYSTSFGKASPEAYERLLLDAMAGDPTLFARRDEVEEAWRFVDHIEHAWHVCPSPPPMAEYAAGSWGPAEADALLRRDRREWRRF